MKQHIDRVQGALSDLADLTEKADKADKQILAGAAARLDDVQSMIARLAPGIEHAPEASKERYLDLIRERGQLQIVIAQSSNP